MSLSFSGSVVKGLYCWGGEVWGGRRSGKNGQTKVLSWDGKEKINENVSVCNTQEGSGEKGKRIKTCIGTVKEVFFLRLRISKNTLPRRSENRGGGGGFWCLGRGKKGQRRGGGMKEYLSGEKKHHTRKSSLLCLCQRKLGLTWLATSEKKDKKMLEREKEKGKKFTTSVGRGNKKISILHSPQERGAGQHAGARYVNVTMIAIAKRGNGK